jgi:hypothetical protein
MPVSATPYTRNCTAALVHTCSSSPTYRRAPSSPTCTRAHSLPSAQAPILSHVHMRPERCIWVISSEYVTWWVRIRCLRNDRNLHGVMWRISHGVWKKNDGVIWSKFSRDKILICMGRYLYAASKTRDLLKVMLHVQGTVAHCHHMSMWRYGDVLYVHTWSEYARGSGSFMA